MKDTLLSGEKNGNCIQPLPWCCIAVTGPACLEIELLEHGEGYPLHLKNYKGLNYYVCHKRSVCYNKDILSVYSGEVLCHKGVFIIL